MDSLFNPTLPAPFVTYFSVYFLGLLLPVGGVVFFLRVALRMRQASEDLTPISDDKLRRRSLGDDALIHGKVTRIFSPEATEAMRVVVTEQIAPFDDLGHVHWREIDRETVAVPFEVTLAGYGPMRVDPGGGATLAGGHESVEMVGEERPRGRLREGDTRRRRAILSLGDEVWISGELAQGADASRGLRGAIDTLVLAASKKKPVEISLSPFDRALRAREAAARRWARRIGIFGVILFVALHLPYVAIVVTGDAVKGVVVKDLGKKLVVRVPGIDRPLTIDAKINKPFLDPSADRRGMKAPLIVTRYWLSNTQAGDTPGESFFVFFLSFALWAIFILVISLSWFRRTSSDLSYFLVEGQSWNASS
ncbi:MAG: hypothetical protein KAI47_10265 [Deltaproteobacteria bacterium]|nr:hypothetical protein [Deltaproteobacteria bacterium]